MSVHRPLVTCLAIAATTGLLFTAACGDDSPAPSPTPSADVTIMIQGNRGNQSYSPNPQTVRVGQTVAWRNADSSAHTSTQDITAGFNTGNLAGGATSTPITMSVAGTFPYHCAIHPSMVGTITVQ